MKNQIFRRLLEHLLVENKEEIAKRSFKHCLVVGLHSIMLLESPGKTIRMYFTDKDHEMWKNHQKAILRNTLNLSLGVHPHHCNLTFQALTPDVFNMHVYNANYKTGNEFELQEFLYHSPLKDQKGSFKYQGTRLFQGLFVDEFQVDRPKKMLANQLHTVYVPMDKETAWLVFEGKEDPAYKPFCYSNHDLEKFDFTGMYQPMDWSEITQAIEKYTGK